MDSVIQHEDISVGVHCRGEVIYAKTAHTDSSYSYSAQQPYRLVTVTAALLRHRSARFLGSAARVEVSTTPTPRITSNLRHHSAALL